MNGGSNIGLRQINILEKYILKYAYDYCCPSSTSVLALTPLDNGHKISSFFSSLFLDVRLLLLLIACETCFSLFFLLFTSLAASIQLFFIQMQRNEWKWIVLNVHMHFRVQWIVQKKVSKIFLYFYFIYGIRTRDI